MTKLLSTFCLVFILSTITLAQNKTKPIPSGVLLEKGIKLHDEKKYKEAIDLYLQINRNDTNYSTALHELSLSYYADSNFNGAIQSAETGLKYFPEEKNKWYNLIANAEDDKGNFDKAILLYNKIIENDKNNYLAWYNKGIVYFNKKQYEEASKNLKQCLVINPFYTAAHYFLAKTALSQGNPIQAMLAFCTNLVLNPDGKYAGASINNLLAIANAKDEVLKNINNNFGDADNFSEQQEILLSKIALDRKYKAKSSLDDNVVKQIQVVMEKTSFSDADKGFFNQFYVPFFEQVFKKDFEKFTYFMFAGLEVKEINDYVKRNKKDLNKFSDETVFPYFDLIRKTREIEFNKRASITKNYFTVNNATAAYATQKQFGKEISFIGEAKFFYPNGQTKSEGNFNDNGEKNGTWKFYYENGELKEINTYNNGKLDGSVNGWFDNGIKSSQLNYTNNEATGSFTNWYYNGSLKKVGNYQNDKENGNSKTYNTQGNLTFSGAMKDDEYDGDFKTYHINGLPKVSGAYNIGKKNGLYKEFHYNGNLYFTGNVENGKKEGVWKEYFYSGKLKAVLNYEKGEQEGEQIYYHENEKIEKKITYQKNKAEGKSEEFYEDGKIYCETMFEKGRLREMTFYDNKGNVYSNTTSKRGDATLMFYNYNGIKTSEGYFNKDGYRSGKTSFYYGNGKLKSEEEYKAGDLEGLRTVYYKNGSKASEVTFKNGSEEGYFVAYNKNQTIQEEGFYEAGQKQGTFKYYNALGNLVKTIFYLNDEEEGFVEYIHPNGKKDYEEQTLNGWFTRINQYDTLGAILEESNFAKGAATFTLKNYNGKIKSIGNIKNYFLNGVYKSFYSNELPLVERFYKNGYADSTFKSYHINGKLNVTGNYLLGDKQGLWKTYYTNGKLTSEETFENGNLTGLSKIYNEHDNSIQKQIEYKNGSINGSFKQYGEQGNLAYITNYEDGYLISYTYEGKDGKLVSPIELKNATGKLVAYYKNGVKSAEIDYDDNTINGARNLFFSNGKPYIVSEKAYGEDIKLKKVFYANGNVESEENHYEDDLHGLCKYFYLDGKPKSEENYYLGSLHGICKYFDEVSGKITTRTYFYGELLK